MPAASAASAIVLRSFWEALGRAMRRVSASSISAALRCPCRSPTTGTPRIRSLLLVGSSSRKPTGSSTPNGSRWSSVNHLPPGVAGSENEETMWSFVEGQ